MYTGGGVGGDGGDGDGILKCTSLLSRMFSAPTTTIIKSEIAAFSIFTRARATRSQLLWRCAGGNVDSREIFQVTLSLSVRLRT